MMKPRMMIKGESGVAAIEFAIVLPVLLLLLIGIIEFSVILYDKAMITNAAREGARAGIVYDHDLGVDPDDPGDDTYHPDEPTIIAKVDQYLQTFLITFGGPDTAVIETDIYRYNYADDPPTRIEIDYGLETAGDALEVTVTYQYGFLLLPALMGGGSDLFNLEATADMRFE
jgi:hypothetical protein